MEHKPDLRRGMGGHHRTMGASDEWYTPPSLFERLGLEFDLDPCAPPGGLPWIPAKRFLSIDDDGLTQPWEGRCWVNPPYGHKTGLWMRRLAAHGDGIGLAFARTDTSWWHDVVPTCHAVCLLRGRVNFVPADERMTRPTTAGQGSGAPSALIAYGDECARAVAMSGLGMTFTVRSRPLLGQASLWEVPTRVPS